MQGKYTSKKSLREHLHIQETSTKINWSIQFDQQYVYVRSTGGNFMTCEQQVLSGTTTIGYYHYM